MEKLTQELLAPYLPYGLRFTGGIWGPSTMIGLVENLVIFEFVDDEIHHSFDLDYSSKEHETRPILKHMRDLTKEELREAGFDNHIDFLTHEHQNNPEVFSIGRAPQKMIQYLIKNHYDINDLIDAGLAVDYKEANNLV